MGFFSKSSRTVKNLEIELTATRAVYALQNRLTPEMLARAKGNPGSDLRAKYQAAVAAGARVEADALIAKFRAEPPADVPATLTPWGSLLDAATS